MSRDFYLSDGVVALRPVEDSDLDFIWNMELEPKRFDDNNLIPKSALKRDMDKGRYWSEKSHVFVIELLQDDGGPVGVIGANIGEKTERIEIGTTVVARWRGLGIGTRAKMLLIDYVFRAYPCNRIESHTAVDNVHAIRSLEKCGFIREGISREKHFVHGRERDFADYSLLRREFVQVRKNWKLTGNSTPFVPRIPDETELPQYTLKGKLIQIRPVELENLGFISELFSYTFPYNSQEFCFEDEFKKEYENEDDSLWGNKYRIFLIETHAGDPLGMVGLFDYDVHNRCVEVGTLIKPADARGKGYGTEAKLLCMGYAFDVWPIERIWAGTNQYNRGARCSLSRAGLRKWSVVAGVHCDARSPQGAALYSVTRDEWMNERTVCDA